jgi:hypothetical protein
MNDRIMQYILEAGTDCSGKWMSLSQAEKFAELIVKECAKFLKETEGPTAYECAELIKQHFGIE